MPASPSLDSAPTIGAKGRQGRLMPVRPAPAFRPVRDRAALVACGLGAAGLVYRIVLVATGVPPANSDEGTVGLAALHIAAGHDFPIFFYGQSYMATILSYAAAPLVGAFGPSWWALRVPTLLLYPAFVFVMYRLTRRLYSPWFAVAIVGLLALGSERVVRNELVNGGGYPEMNPACALLVLVALTLATAAVRHRAVRFAVLGGYAGWGLVAGLVLWDHWLALPYLLVAGVLLIIGCWRQLRGWAGVVLAGTFVVGSAPLLRYNLYAAPGEDSVSVLRAISLTEIPAPLGDRLHGSVIFGLPMSGGLCPVGACSWWQMWWGPVYVALLAVGGCLAILGLLAAARRAAGRQGAGARQGAVAARLARAEWLRQAGRMALVAGAALTVAAYARSAASTVTPAESARYLHYTLISTPAVLWPLWSAAAPLWRRAWQPLRRTGPGPADGARPGRFTLLRGALATAVLGALVTSMVVATGTVIGGVPVIAGRARGDRELVAELRRLGVTRMYSDYWTCNRLTYFTNEQIICAVLGSDLHPGFDRYLPYRAIVAQAPRVAYVFGVNEPIDGAFVAHVRDRGEAVPPVSAVGYHIYLPVRNIDVPLP